MKERSRFQKEHVPKEPPQSIPAQTLTPLSKVVSYARIVIQFIGRKLFKSRGKSLLETTHRLRKITAVIKPFKLEEIKDNLTDLGVTAFVCEEVKGFGRQKGHTEIYRRSEYSVDFLPKIRLEVVVTEEQLDAIVQAVIASAQTGKIGDGKIWIQTVEATCEF